MDASHYAPLVDPLMRQKWLLPGVLLAAATGFVADLAEHGAPRPFIIAGGIGTGPLPDESTADWAMLDVPASTIMEEFRTVARLLADLPPDVQEAVERWDPERTAKVLGNPFVTAESVAGRPVVGGRPAELLALEDKMLADDIWDAAGITRAPSAVVAVDEPALREAHRRLGRSRGTVWSGDTHEGFNGGAEYVRWIREPADIGEAVEFFSRHCRRVRVMPFLEGIPCSIHAVVFPEDTVALRPCEMITLRAAEGRRLRYCGTATYWDPAPTDADEMRSIGERVGEWLRARHDYRGALTIDGVMTEEGFLPTELNSRPGGAMNAVVGTVDGLEFGMIQRSLIERTPFDYQPRRFQQMVLEASAHNRSGRGLFPVPQTVTETTSVYLRHDEKGGLGVADAEESNAGKLELGPHSIGGLVFYKAKGEDARIGPSFMPQAAAAFAVADDVWDTGIGRLQWAESRR